MSFYLNQSPRYLRRPKMYLSSLSINNLRVVNPFMPMWWAFAMPGTGHMMLGKMLKGFLFFVWEFLINTQANINLAIVYSCTGRFQMAKECIEPRWFLIYIGVYIYNGWDAYREATDVNQFAMLAIKEKSPIQAFHINAIEVNYLQKLNPWIPVFWTLVSPGIGHILIRKMIIGFYLMISYIAVVYKSRLLEGIYYTLIGQFQQTIRIMNLEWTLFIPSLFLFSICDCYYHTNEINELFKTEQARYLEKKFPSGKAGTFLKGLGEE